MTDTYRRPRDLTTLRADHYGEHLWPAADSALQLFRDVLNREHGNHGETCAWAAGQLVGMVDTIYRYGQPRPADCDLVSPALLLWARTAVSDPPWREKATEHRSPDPRLLAALERLTTYASTVPAFLPDREDHAALLRAMLGVAITTAARVPMDIAHIPPWVQDEAITWYDRFLP